MRELRVVNVEESRVIVSDDEGEQYQVELTTETLAQVKRTSATNEGPRISVRDVQAHIRSGLTTEEVAALTGATVEFVQKFEGPILAEREFIVTSALAESGLFAADSEGETFGVVIRSKLEDAGARGERWASWKNVEGQWVLKLEFTAHGVDHDARWIYDPKRHSLDAENKDALTLLEARDLSTGLIPKLRAVEETVSITETVTENDVIVAETHTLAAVDDDFDATMAETVILEERSSSPTSDLLEALSRRRRETESTPAWLREELAATPDPDLLSAVTEEIYAGDAADEALLDISPAADETASMKKTGSARKGRAAMPSWDEIVHDTRSEDELF